MRLQRFYLHTPISGTTFDVTDRDLVHQWRSVFRYNVGSQVILFDGSGVDYTCVISSLRNLGATVGVVSKRQTLSTAPDGTPRKHIWLCVGVIKKDNFEWVVQKATELGVSHVVPVLCEHSEKKSVRMDRLQKIAIEAAEQSGRGDVPEILQATTLTDLLQSGQLPQEKVVCHPVDSSGKSASISLRQYIAATGAPSLAAFIGPEGGFSDKEIQLFKTYNMPIVSLGSQILRAETAAIAVASVLLV